MPIMLVREPTNQYDPDAVACHATDGLQFLDAGEFHEIAIPEPLEEKDPD
jgi:hypothetical protein